MDNEFISKAIDLLKQQKVPAKIVRNKREAKLLTEQDPAGHIWNVGDEYYRIETHRKSWGIKNG